MNEPLISVICACRDHGRYMREMADSVMAQTFREFELVIADDGSGDETRAILDSLRGDGVTVLHLPRRGAAAARNSAIAAARAPLLLNLDADDKIAPEYMEKAAAVFKGNPKAGIVYSRHKCFGAAGNGFELPAYSPEAMLDGNIISSAAFFRKTDWEACGGYCGEFIYGLEDYDFWLSIIELGREVHEIPGELCLYRRHANPGDCRSERRKQSRRKMIFSLLKIFERHRKLYERNPEAFGRMLDSQRRWNSECAAERRLREALHFLDYHRKSVMRRLRSGGGACAT